MLGSHVHPRFAVGIPRLLREVALGRRTRRDCTGGQGRRGVLPKHPPVPRTALAAPSGWDPSSLDPAWWIQRRPRQAGEAASSGSSCYVPRGPRRRRSGRDVSSGPGNRTSTAKFGSEDAQAPREPPGPGRGRARLTLHRQVGALCARPADPVTPCGAARVPWGLASGKRLRGALQRAGSSSFPTRRSGVSKLRPAGQGRCGTHFGRTREPRTVFTLLMAAGTVQRRMIFMTTMLSAGYDVQGRSFVGTRPQRPPSPYGSGAELSSRHGDQPAAQAESLSCPAFPRKLAP